MLKVSLFRRLALAATVTALLVSVPNRSIHAQSPDAGDKAKAALAVLRSDAAEADKALACKHLAIYGSADAVPELAKLLDNERLHSWARIGLEAIPGPEADAALRAAMKEFDAKAAHEAVLGEKEDNMMPEELKNVAVEVEPFDTMATIRKQIDEQQAVLTKLFHVFEDVDVEECKFKITHVARNLLALEGVVKKHSSATFDDIITAIVGCASVPTFNGYLARLRHMGIAPDMISVAAFGQHARVISSSTSNTYNAIRGVPHQAFKRTKASRPLCLHILRGGILQCPKKTQKGSDKCSRHSTKRRKC